MGKTKERKKSNRKNQRRKQRKPTTTTTTTTTTSCDGIDTTTTTTKQQQQQQQQQDSSNFVSEAGKGCYIARRRSDNTFDNNGGDGDSCDPDWMIEWEDVNPKDFAVCDCQTIVEVPDIAIDPDEHTLTICNIDDYTKIAYVTIYDTTAVGGHGEKLIPGWTTTDKNDESETETKTESLSCITFIVLCPPRVFAHLCYLINDGDGDGDGDGADNDQDFISNIRIDSDVSKWNQHPEPNDEHPFRIGFPLNCSNANDNDNNNSSSTSFLCTQGEGGELTHFFSGNLHAIDFRCPVGTELLAVADGIIIASKDINTLTGIAVTNLFTWNSILLQISTQNYDNQDGNGDGDNNTEDKDKHKYDPNDIGGGDGGPLFVEYVHISKSLVKAGERVKRGQVIGYSGTVGFSPEPHLHFSAFRSDDNEAPTVRVLFEKEKNSSSCSAGPDLVSSIDSNEEYDNDSLLTFLPRAGEWYDASGMVDKSD